MRLWYKFDDFMQDWYRNNLPWSDIILGTAGLVIGSGLFVIGYCLV